MPNVSISAEVTVSGELGDLAQFGAVTVTGDIEAGLDGDLKAETLTVTSTPTALVLGAVDVSKAHVVLIQSKEPSSATNYVKVFSYDGTNSIECSRLYPVFGRCLLFAPPQTSGYPVYRLATDSGTAKVAFKVVETGKMVESA